MSNMEMITEWSHILLEWVGFGTIVGLLAKAIMPGRDPGGAVATLMMGIGGSVIGAGIFVFFFPEQRVTPLSLMGFVLAVAGAFVLLFFYRLLGGYFFVEGDDGRYHYRRRYRRRSYVYDD
ncbi:Transglycosylase [Planctomycetales bacterium 10988]|nr:Transglycosylase [Planctomycetales bacterium 10988]